MIARPSRLGLIKAKYLLDYNYLVQRDRACFELRVIGYHCDLIDTAINLSMSIRHRISKFVLFMLKGNIVGFVGFQPTVIASRAPHLLLENPKNPKNPKNRGRASPVNSWIGANTNIISSVTKAIKDQNKDFTVNVTACGATQPCSAQ